MTVLAKPAAQKQKKGKNLVKPAGKWPKCGNISDLRFLHLFSLVKRKHTCMRGRRDFILKVVWAYNCF